ncbi:MAG: hypothetical protein KatS3mg082_0660 [Nitrospiraceae bacterium]|nr:MAG: hypothetical protein KatS3mg082_0660 [Nitrospiraceae bacterium]
MIRLAVGGLVRAGIDGAVRHPFRSLLSIASLGLGVGAVLITLAIGSGAKATIVDQILAIGTNAIFVNPGAPMVHGIRQAPETSAALTVADGQALQEAVPLLKSTCWTVGETVQAIRGSRNWKTRVVGITPSCLEIRNWSFVAGRPFDEEDLVRNRSVAIVGRTVLENLFEIGEEAIAAQIRLSKSAVPANGSTKGTGERAPVNAGCVGSLSLLEQHLRPGRSEIGANELPCTGGGLRWPCWGQGPLSLYEPLKSPLSRNSADPALSSGCSAPMWGFEVVGVLRPKGVNAFGYDLDDVIYVPFSTALRRVKGRSLSEPVEAILASTHRREELSLAIEQVRSVLRERHGKEPGQADDFTIKTDVEMSGVGHAADAELTKMLVAVAAVSLLGAGIGIMNMLLVSVTERTREIGVRMAVGAKRRHILVQFLIEAMTLGLVGGVVGILFGIAGARLATVVAGWPTIISAESVVVAFLFSLAVGLFFGLYPANKAARLNPIEALRYE